MADQDSSEAAETPPPVSAGHSGGELLFRVNRRGQEIFNGDLEAFKKAVKIQKIRADDLIYDGEKSTWIFARNHPVFMEITSGGIQDLIEQRRAQARRRWLIRMLCYSLFFSGLIFFLSRYSRQIEFGVYQEPEGGGPFSEADSTAQGAGEEGEGEGAGAGAGAEAGGGGEAEADELEDPSAALAQGKSELELPFDLNHIQAPSDGRRDSLELLSALSPGESLRRAQELYDSAGEGLSGYDQLQEAQSYALFAFRTQQESERGDLERNRSLLQEIQERLRARCEGINGAAFCQLQLQEPRWSGAVVRAVLRKELLLGMDREQALRAWGDPSRIRRQPEGERLCFDRRCQKNYLMVNGKVVEINQGPPPRAARGR